MAPIRTALIGLSSSAVTSWAANAHLPYLLSPHGRTKYQIVALLNSSVPAAQAAISAFKLSPDTKAYGSPADLASDPNVDLVVCVTRVDVHYETIKPSIEAGKDVFVEWPLAQNGKLAGELAGLLREKGGKSVIGLQGRLAPPVVKIKEVIESGRIGKVLSVEARAFGGTNDAVSVPKGLEYFTRREVGGNIYTILFAHSYDLIQEAVGQAVDVHGHFQLQRPVVTIRNWKTGEIEGTTTSDVPDLITTVGTIQTSPTVQEGAQIAFRLRRGPAFPGEPLFEWFINGEKGEIRLISKDGTAIQAMHAENVRIEVLDHAAGKVEPLDWQWAPWQKDLAEINARNIGALYEAFAEGKDGGYPTLEDALARHQQLDEIISSWKA